MTLSGSFPLSKSRFLAGLQCSKRLWLEQHAPTVGANRESSQQILGHEITEHARNLFPHGILAGDASLPFKDQLSATQSLLRDRNVSAIYEAAFSFDNIFARVDVLEKTKKGWGIREVKASTNVKPEHLLDVAIQLYVLARCGIRVTSVELVHVNADYVLKVGKVRWDEFFVRAELLDKVRTISLNISDEIASQRKILADKKVPSVDPGRHCGSPQPCEFWERCTSKKPDDWIFYLPRLGEKKYNQLKEMNVESIREIPAEFPLNPKQKVIREVLDTKIPYLSEGLKRALKDFGPPALYLDFEAMNPAVPVYPGTHPYQRIPFQWSLHFLEKNGFIEHHEFLAKGEIDPRAEFIKTLLEALSKSDWPIVVYSGYEKSVIEALKTVASKRQIAQLAAIQKRLRDLLNIVREHLYYPEFDFSYSIKKVAPALVSGFGYADLPNIANGEAAAIAFQQIATGKFSSKKKEDLRKALLKYCQRDTEAMLRVHQAILQVV